MAASPGWAISPAAINCCARALSASDQALPGRRGDISSSERVASSLRGRLSVQPKHSASSVASSWVSAPWPLRGMTSQTLPRSA